MKTGAAITARRLLNLYRSAFAIDGEWSAVNKVFVNESNTAVIKEISELPCGDMLVKHISNLKTGKTKMNAIDSELLPYNGMMHTKPVDVDPKELSALKKLLESFQPDEEHINQIKLLPIVQRFGDRWASGVRSVLHDDSLIAIWRDVLRADNALRLWARGNEILNSTPSDLLRANVQADMFEYETYLPMFGRDGITLLAKLRQFIL